MCTRNSINIGLKFILSVMLMACLSFGSLAAQEFDIKVTVTPSNSSMLSDPQIFKNLEVAVSEFLNRTKWTNDEYQPHEKIKGSIQFIIKREPSINNFVADLVVKTVRPVYNTSYETDILSFTDADINFSYIVGQVLQRSDNIYYDNLSSTLTFFAYIMLGMDYDTFSAQGGEDYFVMAREVRSALPASIQTSDPSWGNNAIVTRNKFYLVSDFLDPRIKPARTFIYDYHRNILDNMTNDPDLQRAKLVSSISTLDKVLQSYPNSLALQIFADAKRGELVEIFKVADSDQKSRIYDLMMRINPSQAKYFEALKN